MRLINAETKLFEVFSDERKLPPYAILSHRWIDGQEIIYKDFLKGRNLHLRGRKKIDRCCLQALEDGISYVWVDTCCIDKQSSAELSEAINSMYRWYGAAKVCYAYLSDVVSGRDWDQAFIKSSWFTRSWTLQEMLAPASLKFFDSSWCFLGEKAALSEELAEASGIHLSVFTSERLNLSDWSIAQRMSWASRREATRVEDVSYSLLGIFQVNMPLLYGEGSKAFRRLQEEIIRDRYDHTIFAWSTYCEGSNGLLAASPASFEKDGSVVIREFQDAKPYAMTNLGLSIELSTQLWLPRVYWAGLNATENGFDQIGIWLLEDKTRNGSYDKVAVPQSMLRSPELSRSTVLISRRSDQCKCRSTPLNVLSSETLSYSIPQLGSTVFGAKGRAKSFASFASFFFSMVNMLDLPMEYNHHRTQPMPSADVPCQSLGFMTNVLMQPHIGGNLSLIGIEYVSHLRPCIGIAVDIIFPTLSHALAMLTIGFNVEMCPIVLVAETFHFQQKSAPETMRELINHRTGSSHNVSLLNKNIWQCDGLEDHGWLEPSRDLLEPSRGMSKGLWAFKATEEPISRFLFRLQNYPDRYVEIVVERQYKDRCAYNISFNETLDSFRKASFEHSTPLRRSGGLAIQTPYSEDSMRRKSQNNFWSK